ncbi:protein SDE2 [Biomphalaria pfeifferi]|uniref:Protein SDE2 n=1 Tax=Biomphalaria pfeifferi TaxID=112525 RepID=A0AAD8BCU3_BIOPF|nr:protein SDE2 [Biomphalaria pfeifferi]
MAPNIIICSSHKNDKLRFTSVDILDLRCVDDLMLCVITELIQRSRSETVTQQEIDSVKSCFYVVCNGRKLSKTDLVKDGNTYHIVPRLLGGKGGFGSMLRAIGAQIEKTTSREACRDLSGRRMRDINNEKKLKEWLAKEADREQEREARRQERLAKHLAPHRHKFDDKEYQEQKQKVQEDLEEALSTGLKRKLKEPAGGASCSKKSKEAVSIKLNGKLGADLDSDDLDSSDGEAHPGSVEDSPEQNTVHSSSNRDSEESMSSSAAQTPILLVDSDKNISEMDPKSDPSVGTVEKLGHEQLSENTRQADIEPVDLESFDGVEELSKLGLERLKNALIARGLKCGGSLQERAVRLFL